MLKHYKIERALLTTGWATNVEVAVGDDGLIVTIDSGERRVSTEKSTAQPPVEIIRGTVVPGMPNAHSHAFQRAMAGDAEYRRSAKDSFWTWRTAMYGLANRITPEDLKTVATQLYVEMLKAGYTTVAEFHYLHRHSDGSAYGEHNALWDAIHGAADAAGIGFTFLPTLYQTSDFGNVPLRADQARFAFDTESFLRRVEERIAADRAAGGTRVRTGVAFHSLRAVPPQSLHEAAHALRGIDATMPIHIHIAEQVREVDACKLVTGRRPIEWLLETGLVTPQWCLVHATHATAVELKGIAAADATVCVSITTEANLGDGFFDTARYLSLLGKLCIGSDSHCSVSPAEELRWLEYQQRLRKKRRGVLAGKKESHVGTRLWQDAARHGAHATGQPVGALAVGKRADWLVLDREHPSLAGADLNTTLDHVVFAAASAAIRDVMVAGRWVIKDGRHGADDVLQPRFAAAMQRLAVLRAA